MSEERKSKLTKLLEKLQEESWQLELIISGFAIFLVASSLESIQGLVRHVEVYNAGLENAQLLRTPVLILMVAWLFLLINLIIHVVLRGFWIAAIGLRYVSGDVDFEALRFAPKFDRYLKRRVPEFDIFIERLEKLCSVVFAFTFIIIFMLISVGLFYGFVSVLNYLIKLPFHDLPNQVNVLRATSIITLVFLFFAFIYFIDFITLGWVKRIKWFSRVYFPIYWIMSTITLSSLYRPLYYNLIDDKFGRKVGYLLFPYMFILLTIFSAQVEAFKYFPLQDPKEKLQNRYYLDLRDEDRNINEVVIPSMFPDQDYLEVFVPYNERYDDEVEKLCPDIQSDNLMGIRFDIIQINTNRNVSSSDTLLDCVSRLHQIYINDSLYATNPYFYLHPNMDEPGLLHVVDIQHLQRGEQQFRLEVANYNRSQDTLRYVRQARFPFWK